MHHFRAYSQSVPKAFPSTSHLKAYLRKKKSEFKKSSAVPVCFRLPVAWHLLHPCGLFLHLMINILQHKKPVNISVYGSSGVNHEVIYSASPSRARTYNPAVNSRVLYHWAIEDCGKFALQINHGRTFDSSHWPCQSNLPASQINYTANLFCMWGTYPQNRTWISLQCFSYPWRKSCRIISGRIIYDSSKQSFWTFLHSLKEPFTVLSEMWLPLQPFLHG